jgi:hypothetical protein
MEKPLVEVELISAEIDELRYPQPVAIGQEDHGVIAEPMPPDTPGGLAEAVDFGRGQVLPGPDVRMFVALGKGELRHGHILSEELSCLRWLDPEHGKSATSGTTSRSPADIPENASKQESGVRSTRTPSHTF